MKKWLFPVLVLSLFACEDEPKPMMEDGDLTEIPYEPVYRELQLPDYAPDPSIPSDNQLTEAGIDLGRHLFYDNILSADGTQSCASCHKQDLAFTDGNAVSVGIDGIAGTKSSMTLVNSTFIDAGLFWDGRSTTLEEQALLPVEDPIELHDTWPNVEQKLRNSTIYPEKFRKAFGIENKAEITKELAAKAMAQFQRTLISYDSKFDKWLRDEVSLTDDELLGYLMYIDDPTDPTIPDAQCEHCHSLPSAMSNEFFNNGLQEAATLNDFADKGRGKVTEKVSQNGFFRAVTLRNIEVTGPYMHDGRLETLDDVIEHYASGGNPSPNKDPLLDDIHLSEYEKSALKSFLLTLTDTSFLSKEEFSNPFE